MFTALKDAFLFFKDFKPFPLIFIKQRGLQFQKPKPKILKPENELKNKKRIYMSYTEPQRNMTQEGDPVLEKYR